MAVKALTTNLLTEFIDALNESANCASQLVHIYQDPRWIAIREALIMARAITINLAASEVLTP